ncbi:MAG: site-specific DNA-methyltransferase [Planctomycetota bacterium]
MSVGTLWTSVEEGQAHVGCGDWLDVVLSLRNDEFAGERSIDLMYVDPPFNTGKVQRAESGEYEDRWESIEAYLSWLQERLEATLVLLKESGSMLVHVDWRTSHRVRVLLDEMLGVDCFVNHLIWSYGLGGSSPRRFARKHDDILMYSVAPDGHWFEPPMVAATSQRMKGQMKKATDVLDVPALNNMASERVGYPTQKPIALLDMLVKACCPEGGVVLDPCCGSGTTLVAAVNSGRRAIGIDRSERAIEVAMDRLIKGSR